MNKRDWEKATLGDYTSEGLHLFTAGVERLEGRKVDWTSPEVEKCFRKVYLFNDFILWMWKDTPILVGTSCQFDLEKPKTASWMFEELYHAN